MDIVLVMLVRLSGWASKESAAEIKEASSLALIYLTGSWMSAAASYSTSSLLKKFGFSATNARIGGEATAVAVNLAQSFTPMGAAVVATSFLAGKFGLWAEKCVVECLDHTNQEPLIPR